MTAQDRPEGNMIMLSRRLPPLDSTLGLQRRLNQAGFKAGPEDDIYGPKTQAAVRRFQAFCAANAGGDNPRIIDAGPLDGIAGRLTKAALLHFYGS
jgi:peptidoglycan hydrolase-like protein with peptidoglycan-binding domain